MAKNMNAEIVKLNTLLARALSILENMINVDDDPCEFDHHGYCQAHNWFYTEPKCPDARAKELLKECGRTG